MSTSKLLAIKNDEKCNKCILDNDCSGTRKEIIEDCIPLTNISASKINILNFEKTNYIYFNDPKLPTYYIDNKFKLNRYEEIEILHKQKQIKELYDYLDKQINLPLTNETIPVYYLFVNSDNIFNLFICQYNILIGEKEKAIYELKQNIESINNDIIKQKKQVNITKQDAWNEKSEESNNKLKYEYTKLNNIEKELDKQKIQLSNEEREFTTYVSMLNSIFRSLNNIYVGLSFKLNVFNVALLCNKYWNLCNLFLRELTDEELDCELHIMFKDFDIINLHLIINEYKFKLAAISKDIEFTNFMGNKFKENNIKSGNKKYQDYKRITDIEKGIIPLKTNKDIIIYFRDMIKFVKNIVSKIKPLINDFDKIFLMSFLSKRIKEGLISNTWPFDYNYIYEYIITSSTNNTYLQGKTDIDRLMAIYTEEKPIIYEYSSVKYKSTLPYGNCMENTIFQFLKIIFWNQEKDAYDYEYIEKIVKLEFQEKIKSFIRRIDSEKNPQFIYDWVEFITELPKDPNNIRLKLKYDFIQPLEKIEINAKLINLIIALKCLINDNLLELTKYYEPTDFIDEIVKTINTDYSVERINTDQVKKEDTIILICNKKYTIQLYHNVHAKFENAKLDNAVNILEKITKSVSKKEPFYIYLNEFLYLTVSDIPTYVCLNYANSESLLCKMYMSSLNIDMIFNSYKLLLNDANIYTVDHSLIYNMLTNDSVLEFLMIQNIFGNTFFHDILNYRTSDLKEEIFETVSYKKFLNMTNKNGYTVWHIIALSSHFNMIKSCYTDKEYYEQYSQVWNIQDKYGDTVWHILVSNDKLHSNDNKYYNSDNIKWTRLEFEKFIIENNIYKNWGIKNNKGYSIIELASETSLFSLQFWETIIWEYYKDQQVQLDIYDQIYDYANSLDYYTEKSKDNSINNYLYPTITLWIGLFTKKIYILNDKILLNFNAYIWKQIIKYIDSETFDTIMNINEKLFLSWNIIKDNKITWFYAITEGHFSKKFFINVITNKLCDKWIFINDDDNNLYNNTIWHYAVQKTIFPNLFWQNVAEQKLYNEWTKQNNNGESIWDLSIDNIESDKFWEIAISQLIIDMKLPVAENYDDGQIETFNKLWIKAIDNKIIRLWHTKTKNNIIIWKKAFECIDSNFFWTKLITNNKKILYNWNKIYDEFGNTLWNDAIKYIKNSTFWIYVLTDNQLYLNWNNKNIDGLSTWDYAREYIDDKQFWVIALKKEVISSKNRIEIIKKLNLNQEDLRGGNNYKEKYEKYKMKYLQLKKNAFK